MATASANIAAYNNTDADFRAWGSFISNALAAGGLTKVWDNGANWASVAKPASTSTYPVREVWQLADGGAAMYVMLDYGSGTSSALSPSLRYHIGSSYSGSDGSINSVNSSTLVALNAGAAAATLWPCLVSADVDGFVIAMWWGTTAATWTTLMVERLDAADGTGVMYFGGFGTGTRRCQVVNPDGGSLATAETNMPLVLAPTAANNVLGLRTGMAQLNFFAGPVVRGPRQIIATGNTTWSAGTSLSITVNGAARNYTLLSTSNTSHLSSLTTHYTWALAE